ncbi:hypothetical protein [Haloferax sp. Atlit-6N]|uniref:hypothetical protein n=1 Tax=Haloferax sp. Atlit-6N TaxID=2077205 RepID=UPI0011C05663|nr:hypothetical protein [Haloferax sp. Atlit-6N]
MPTETTPPVAPEYEEYVPEAITSLRQLEVLYGALNESRTEQSVVDDTYALFQTPTELAPFTAADETDMSRQLVVLHIDVTGPAPQLRDITVQPLTADIVPLLGYARYPWGQAIDHSITQRGSLGGASAGDVSRYARECLLQWTDSLDSEPAISTVAEDHPDGWLIEAVSFVGSEDGLFDRLEAAFAEQFADEPRVVVTVGLHVHPERLDVPPATQREWYFPGELDVFNAAMRARKIQKLSTKHNSRARGEGVGMVTNTTGELVGTADDPLGLYSTRQVDTFAHLERDTSWRTHPLRVESALLLQSATEYLDACRWTRNGLQTYLLPYPQTTTTDTLPFVSRLLEAVRSDELHPVSAAPRIATEANGPVPDELRYYRLVVNNDQGDISVYRETGGIDPTQCSPLIAAHRAQFPSWLFSDGGFTEVANWLLLSPPEQWELTAAILDGRYAAATLPVELHNNRARLDNPVDELTDALLTKTSVSPRWLLNNYLTKLRRVRADDAESRLSHYHVLTQLAQLHALDASGYLAWPGFETTAPPNPPQLGSSPQTFHRARTTQFAQHIAHSTQHRAAFYFGVALGQASALQRRHGRQLTLDEQYPVETFSPQSRETVQSLIESLATAGDSLRHKLLRKTLQLPTQFTSAKFRSDSVVMRFYLAIGSTFGRVAYGRIDELTETDS